MEEEKEEAYKKYTEFDFKASEEWHTYFDGLFPVPPKRKVEKFKRKFYNRKIDPNFDVSYKMENSN